MNRVEVARDPLPTADELINSHLSLVSAIASRLANRLRGATGSREDLVSVGVIGLIEAARKADPENTTPEGFRAYAAMRIRGSMIDYLRDEDRVPRAVRRNAREIDRVSRDLAATLGRPPEEGEVAAALETDTAGLRRMQDATRLAAQASHDVSLVNDDGDELAADERMPDPFEHASRNELVRMFRGIIDEMPESMRIVLTLYYYDELNYAEIAEVLGVTVSRTSQIHTAAIAKLKLRLRRVAGEDV